MLKSKKTQIAKSLINEKCISCKKNYAISIIASKPLCKECKHEYFERDRQKRLKEIKK